MRNWVLNESSQKLKIELTVLQYLMPDILWIRNVKTPKHIF